MTTRRPPRPIHDGWFSTGDVATIDPDGYMEITDRAKDVIKSGGEWISSIDAREHRGRPSRIVAEAAVIGCPPSALGRAARCWWWSRMPSAELDKAQILAFLEDKVAKWWLPDDVVFVDELPHTATGKIAKARLREQLKDHRLPGT